MSPLLRSVPHVDLEAAAMHGIAEANRAAVLIFDLFGVWKSKLRGSPRLLHVENRKNQNPVAAGRVRTAGRASDINQCFFKIRTATENLGFCSRKSKEIKTRGRRRAFDLFLEIKNSAEILGFFQKNIKQIKQFKRRCPQTRNARRAEANLIFYQVWKNQVSAETLGVFQVGNQDIKFEQSGGSAIRPSHIRGVLPDTRP